jgi:hypothetical protein
MEENKFEKSVQRELKDLKLKPSEAIWTKVEERIREKKKRRVFFILFFLFGIALLGYWQRDYFFDGEINEIGQTEKNIEKPKGSTTTIVNEDHSAKSEDQANKEKPGDVIEKLGIKTSDKLKEIKNSSSSENSVKPDRSGKKENSEIKKESKIKQQQTITDSKEKKESKEETIVITQPVTKKDTVIQKETVVSDPQIVHTDSAITNPVTLSKDEVKKDAEISQNTSDVNSLRSDTNNVTVQKDPPSKKWKLGLVFTPGTSSFDDGIFSLNMNKSFDLLYANPNSSGSGSQNQPAPPTSSKAGFAFQTGAFLINQFSSRSSFSIGLQYAYYSEHISVGARKDSVLRYASQASVVSGANYVYSAAGTKENFTNNYHFVEIPAIYQLGLNKNKFKPLNWTVGLSVAQLVNAKTLAYDTSFGGIYYDNKKSLNKTQFSLTTGFNWGIFNSKKIKGSIGPVVDFHFNSLLNNEGDKNKHLLFAGIRTTFTFPGK